MSHLRKVTPEKRSRIVKIQFFFRIVKNLLFEFFLLFIFYCIFYEISLRNKEVIRFLMIFESKYVKYKSKCVI
jgi:1-acyl-sn-glycerol-3-phosphate acyltransferase